jgi:hypothetical protein
MSLPVHLTLDVDQMRACMVLWREALVIAEHDVAAREERRAALTRINRALDGWLDLLHLCNAVGVEQRRLAVITKEVVAFRDWADEANLALALLKDAGGITTTASGTRAQRERNKGRNSDGSRQVD